MRPHGREEAVLATLALVAGGGLLGVSCAHAVPSKVAPAVSAAVVLCILALTVHHARKEEEDGGQPVPSASGAASVRPTDGTRRSGRDASSDAESHAGSAPLPTPSPEAEAQAEPEPEPAQTPEPEERRKSAAPRNLLRGASEPTLATVPLKLRVEQEKRRLSATGGTTGGATATAYCLRFPDVRGRWVRYTARSSQQRGGGAFLELTVEGRHSRRVRAMAYDTLSQTIHDGKKRFALAAADAPLVVRSLTLLCKVCAVPLEVSEGAPGTAARGEGAPGVEGPTHPTGSPSQ